jgi:hypothetical protein
MRRVLARAILCVLLLLSGGLQLSAQKSYAVRNGRMYITLAKNLAASAIDSFITQFDLADLGLKHFIKTGIADSLKSMGWKVEVNTSTGLIISKPLLPAEGITGPADKIRFTEKSTDFATRFPAVSSNITYGYNRFRNILPFEVRKDKVRFFLRGNTGAHTVYLSGSFNDWSPTALRMTKVEDGWVAHISIAPGKYWYKFIIDGNWEIDNDNRLQENDGEGNTNSVYFRPNTVFTLHGYEKAKRVFVAGNFNNWRPGELRMIKTPIGWELPIYLADGTHTYKYVVDGQWVDDAYQKEKLPDGHGGFNSVYRIGSAHLFSLKGFATAKQVMLAGSFNGWRDDELPLRRSAGGWELPYTLGPGNYEYRFKVDGQWITDPGNTVIVSRDNKPASFLTIGANYTFRLKGYASAKNVFLAGDFNNWSPASLAMKRAGGEWVFPVHLSRGKHTYKFYVDGEWIIDPGNKLWEQNEYGTGNSVLWIEK